MHRKDDSKMLSTHGHVESRIGGCKDVKAILDMMSYYYPALASADDETWEAINREMTTTWSYTITYSEWFDEVIAKIREPILRRAMRESFKMTGE